MGFCEITTDLIRKKANIKDKIKYNFVLYVWFEELIVHLKRTVNKQNTRFSKTTPAERVHRNLV